MPKYSILLAILHYFMHSWYIYDHQGLNCILKTQKNIKLSLKNRIETPSIQQIYDDYVNLGGGH